MKIEFNPYTYDGKCEYGNGYYSGQCNCKSHRRDREYYSRENGTNRYYRFYSQWGDSDEESHYWKDDESAVSHSVYYSILQIEPPINIDDLKKAYRKKALKVHPDKTGGDSSEFLKVKDAYDKLMECC